MGRLPSLMLPFLLLAWLALLGYGNEGSSTGSCFCNKRLSSDSATDDKIKHLRNHLKGYDQCTSYVRFHLPSRTVCGGIKERWVIELVNYFNLRECGQLLASPECGHDSRRVVHQEHLPPSSTQVPELTKGDSLEAGENQKQMKENMRPTADISVIVAVLSLLAIIFILTGVLLYVLCKRRKQSLQYPPDLQFHYIPVTPDSNA